MNDFTKDELILILGFLRGAYSVTHDGTELKAEKIISMIDNYCDKTRCTKCGEFYRCAF